MFFVCWLVHVSSIPMASTQCMQIRWLSQKSETCLQWAKNVAGLWATICLDNFAVCFKTPLSGSSVFQKMSPDVFNQHFWIQNTNVSWCFFIHFVGSMFSYDPIIPWIIPWHQGRRMRRSPACVTSTAKTPITLGRLKTCATWADEKKGLWENGGRPGWWKTGNQIPVVFR